MAIAWGLNVLALAFGVCLGARGLLDPRWAARLVRLQADEQGGGFAEFRATYGGVFLGLHAAALMLTAYWLMGGAPAAGAVAAGASAVLAAGWGGAAFGRLVSIWRDKTDTGFNRVSVLVEATLAALIAAPWAVWMLL
jgi:hypothetical protein